MRDKIIDLLYAENVRSDCGIERLADEICAIDPARWIPVSERLPEENGRYLVTCEQRGVADAKYWHRERVWVKDWAIIYVTAWMPLPEPWRGEE